MSFFNRLSSLFSPKSAPPPGAVLAATMTRVSEPRIYEDRNVTHQVHQAPSLGFVPVAIHFDLFGSLVRRGGPATAEDIANAYNAARTETEPELCMKI